MQLRAINRIGIQVDAHDSFRKKVWQIFADAFGDRANIFKGGVPARHANEVLAAALAEELDPSVADEVAFHMVDWETDAAFVTALLMFPEKFTREELQAAVDLFLIHVPAHVLAAARLAGYDTRDIFVQPDQT